jgi:selenocysteine lyase/cysteine desulfurase
MNLEIKEIRDLFPVTKNWIYFYNGGITACPKPVGNAMRAFLKKWEDNGRDAWPPAFDDFLELKNAFGRLIGADGSRIAITESTTAAINLVAGLVRPQKEQNVVVTELEYMSDTYPWIISHPAQVRFIPENNGRIIEDEIPQFVDENTAVLSVSAVAVGSGYRADLKKVHQATSPIHIPLLVDGAQAVGVMPLNINDPEIDFLVCTANKWLFGPAGVGFLYVGDRFIQADPPNAGWLAAANRRDWDLQHPVLYEDAMRFQCGMPNLIGAVGSLAGIRLIEEIGVDVIQGRIEQLTTYLIEQLELLKMEIWTPKEKSKRAGIVFFKHPAAKELYQTLQSHQIYTGNFLGGIRLDVHVFNTTEEIDKMLDVIKAFVLKA